MSQINGSLLSASPGIPGVPTPSFWSNPPSPIATYRSSLPAHASVVIIGSGITGTSVARELLRLGQHHTIVMLEARNACDGATGRNGGHIDPEQYQDYEKLVEDHGESMAQEIIRFRLSHKDAMRAVAEEEDLIDYSHFRKTEAMDAFMTREEWENAKMQIAVFRKDMPKEAAVFRLHDSTEVSEYGLKGAFGGVTGPACALHPYRFVTGILARLLERHPDRFHLLTNTPCTSISAPSSPSALYTVHTPIGDVTTPHVVHCTNAYCSHFLVPMRGCITPVRSTMSAQIPPQCLQLLGDTPSSTRSFVLYGNGYHYFTQLPTTGAELMCGGGVCNYGDEPGVVDDGSCNPEIAADLARIVPEAFSGGASVGLNGTTKDSERDGNSKERVLAIWTGIFALSADGVPWVGRLTPKLTGRAAPVYANGSASGDSSGLAAPGEWLCGGYSGEGMPHAWRCGQALAHMVLGKEVDWLPGVMAITEKRWEHVILTDAGPSSCAGPESIISNEHLPPETG